MLALSPERRARIRVYAGHLPYVASELLGIDVIRLTLLRDPVDRTVSMLKHVKRLFERYHSASLEAIYDDDPVFRHYLDNYQTKVFALTAEERAPRSRPRGATAEEHRRSGAGTLGRRDPCRSLGALRAREGEPGRGRCRRAQRALRRLPRRACTPDSAGGRRRQAASAGERQLRGLAGAEPTCAAGSPMISPSTWSSTSTPKHSSQAGATTGSRPPPGEKGADADRAAVLS